MYDGQSLSHTKWECKYHIVWIPKVVNDFLAVSIQLFPIREHFDQFMLT